MTTSATTQTLIDGITAWMQCESPTSSPAGVAAMVADMARYALEGGLQATVTPLGERVGPLLHVTNRAAGDTRPGLLVLGHSDTVHPVGTLSDNPCRIEGDRFYGPGGYDMKAGIYLAMTALRDLAAAGASAMPIDFVVVPDEETGSHASRVHIERFAHNARYALVCEPARANGGRCVTARKGTGMLRLGVKGHAAHAGVAHEKGRSAIREMAHQILALEAMTDYARGVTVSVGTIEGGTATNTVPAQCRCVVDFRLPDLQAADELVHKMQALRPVGADMELDIEVEVNRPPMVKSEAVVALLDRAKASARHAGFALEDAPMTGGGSDANFTSALGVPTLDGLGADGDGAHTLQEHILVSTLEARLNFWRHMLAHLA
ncbi:MULTISPECIES: M20 family metallopeptidase [unclassified Acidovorax]|uniref:M20 family metallopeptidase n=1 Tax=unclassified Acidovorax TaxID=2684926 RepID=UPI001C48C95F|nr:MULTISPECIES: M20 family metallopeptidase [unclassified Acidovorax]MBV7430711.1 M20 family metallopeptidase [Acidovorax sp. sif0732]MBV7449135.1 M20 family metallopeptidase [Acidovorax sp. sif0715]